MEALPRVILATAFTAGGFLQGTGVVRAQESEILEQYDTCGYAPSKIPSTELVRVVRAQVNGVLREDAYVQMPDGSCGREALPPLVSRINISEIPTDTGYVSPTGESIIPVGSAICPSGTKSVRIFTQTPAEGVKLVPEQDKLDARGNARFGLVLNQGAIEQGMIEIDVSMLAKPPVGDEIPCRSQRIIISNNGQGTPSSEN